MARSHRTAALSSLADDGRFGPRFDGQFGGFGVGAIGCRPLRRASNIPGTPGGSPKIVPRRSIPRATQTSTPLTAQSSLPYGRAHDMAADIARLYGTN
jgi:hypothetical protein